MSKCAELFTIHCLPSFWNLCTEKTHNLKNRFEFVSQSEDFKKLSLKDVMKLLNSQDLIVSSEESIFTSVERWILHDKENRLPSFDELTSTVRYSLLSEQYLDNLIKNNQLVINSKRYDDSLSLPGNAILTRKGLLTVKSTSTQGFKPFLSYS